MPFATRHRRTLREVQLIGLLILGLLCAQWLGLAHRTRHNPHATAAATASDPHANVFAGHAAGDPACLLYDALAPGQPTTSATVFVSAGPIPWLAVFSHPACVARHVALFDARGPPVSR
ncbi:hypothetical protein JI739_00835 [Ramlibacter sp. AW1]|uniref:DUF2946 domain-containing protein n=1 Tax=Ramlibacter aurantiacus TaxID=2801330 RepID=A0A937D1K8_9BURK|nr:hypothetical protein [Ramlibacter aurantiacus]MBL0418880.1 hypothetical protein [Ramlibacter aurantiacus]